MHKTNWQAGSTARKRGNAQVYTLLKNLKSLKEYKVSVKELELRCHWIDENQNSEMHRGLPPTRHLNSSTYM